MNSKHLGLKIRKEDAKDILHGFIYILCGFIFCLLILLSCSGIIKISKYVYMRNIVPKCTAQTEATVLHYEDLPDPFDEVYIHNTRTLVETDLGNGLQEVELRGMQGKHEGDILILHYNPDNIKQFYTEVKQTAPDASDEYLTTGWLIALFLSALLNSFAVTFFVIRTENKEREKNESEKQSEGDE